MAGLINNGGCGSGGYSFEVDAYVCSEAGGTLRVYWNKFDCSGYTEVITQTNWDGTEVTAQFEDPNFCSNGGSPIPLVSLGVTMSSPDAVTIDWSVDTSACWSTCINNAPVGGSFDVSITPGGTCNVPHDDSDQSCVLT